MRDDLGHGVGMGQRVLARVQRLVRNQRCGEGSRTRQHLVYDGRAIGRGGRQRIVDDEMLRHRNNQKTGVNGKGLTCQSSRNDATAAL